MRNTPPAADHEMEFTGGALSLDFANTVGGTHVAPTHDHLQSYRDLVEFAVRSGSLTAEEGRRLEARAAREPNRAEAVFGVGLALREAVWSVFSALASGETARERDLSLISDAAAAGLARSRVFVDRGARDRRGPRHRRRLRRDGEALLGQTNRRRPKPPFGARAAVIPEDLGGQVDRHQNRQPDKNFHISLPRTADSRIDLLQGQR